MQTLRASKLGLDPNELSPAILDVIDTLSAAGYDAYIVGGGVRDLLLGLHPKDFDAVTNATPQQIREVFGKRCRIIGRRFELAHVYSGRDMIEVATFRAPPRRPRRCPPGRDARVGLRQASGTSRRPRGCTPSPRKTRPRPFGS